MKVLLAAVLVILLGLGVWYSPLNQQTAALTSNDSVAVISRQDILQATDLVAGVKLAVKQHDEAAVKKWLEKATELAIEAGLPQEDINYLKSDMAVNYVEFHAKRSLFNDAVEQAYYALYDIEPLKIQYPEAQDLFDKTDKLIADRDQIIQQIANELAQGQNTDEQTLEAARQLWKQRFTPTKD
jgi:hypothetical protein